MSATYSFLDVHAAIVGVGGSFSLGSGAGAAKEGITITQTEDIDTMTIGADGQGMHTLHADKSGKVTVRLLKTSPTNALLSAMVAFQRTSGANHGNNTITIVNSTTGDAITCEQCAFSRIPDITYAQEADVIQWVFNAVTINIGLGAGL
jgi:Protein of unknown function (DUF3277)